MRTAGEPAAPDYPGWTFQRWLEPPLLAHCSTSAPAAVDPLTTLTTQPLPRLTSMYDDDPVPASAHCCSAPPVQAWMASRGPCAADSLGTPRHLPLPTPVTVLAAPDRPP